MSQSQAFLKKTELTFCFILFHNNLKIQDFQTNFPTFLPNKIRQISDDEFKPKKKNEDCVEFFKSM